MPDVVAKMSRRGLRPVIPGRKAQRWILKSPELLSTPMVMGHILWWRSRATHHLDAGSESTIAAESGAAGGCGEGRCPSPQIPTPTLHEVVANGLARCRQEVLLGWKRAAPSARS